MQFIEFKDCGSEKRTVRASNCLTVVECGCFEGTYIQFRKAVRAKYGASYGPYYLVITVLHSMWLEQKNKV